MKYNVYSSLDSEDRLPQFAKDKRMDEFLELFNSSLGDCDKYLGASIDGKAHPSLLIVSHPRSGSTLMTQVLAARLNIEYVSNLMARFYGAPLTGAYLQKNLLGDRIKALRTFRSTHGNTNELYEPNEFGYFWSTYIGMNKESHQPESDEDLRHLKIDELEGMLNKISGIFGKPVIYKCTIAPFLLSEIMKIPNLFVIYLKRNKESTVKSILKVRKERLGDVNKWWSIRPANFKELMKLEPQEQVSAQYDLITQAIEAAESYGGNRYHRMDYEDIVENPESEIDKLIAKLNNTFEYDFSKTGSQIIL